MTKINKCSRVLWERGLGSNPSPTVMAVRPCTGPCPSLYLSFHTFKMGMMAVTCISVSYEG